MSDTDDKIKQKLNKVFVNPQLQSAIVDAVVYSRPHGWGRRSVAPYYKERFGKEMKPILDEMIKTREDQLFEYEDFKKKFGISKETLYLRINQSMRYVIDKMDDVDHTYGRFCEMVEVNRERNVGVIIRFRPECREGEVSNFVPKAVEPKDSLPVWREQLNEFLENSTPGDKPFFKEKLALTPEQIQDLTDSLTGIGGILFNVTSYSVKVIRVNTSDA